MASEKEGLGLEELQVQSLIAQANKAVGDLERKLTELPLENGPSLELRPPGMPADLTSGSIIKRRIELKEAIEKTKNQVLEETDRLVSGSPGPVKDNARALLNDWLQTDADKNADLSKEKNLDKAQDFALNLRYNKRVNPDLAKHKTLDQSQEFALKLSNNFPSSKGRADHKTVDQSQDFALTLLNGKKSHDRNPQEARAENSERHESDVNISNPVEKASFNFFQELKLNSISMEHIAEAEKDAPDPDADLDPDKDK